jgi:hypothetical protein
LFGSMPVIHHRARIRGGDCAARPWAASFGFASLTPIRSRRIGRTPVAAVRGRSPRPWTMGTVLVVRLHAGHSPPRPNPGRGLRGPSMGPVKRAHMICQIGPRRKHPPVRRRPVLGG